MRRRLAAMLSLLFIVAGLGAAAPAQAATGTTGFHWNDITAADGAVLKSNVIAPRTPGRHPGIVFVASWGLNDLQYLAQAKVLAERGYVVLSYTARGFWLSGGKIDVAGPADVADASTAVDWMLAHTTVDPRRIGIVGVSYGGGISLLAAAHDRRIRAVASLSGWADMSASLHGNETRRPQAAFFLQAVANVVGRPSEEMNRVLADYWADRGEEYREEWARKRSVRYSVDDLNRNRPAVLITHQFGDSVFPANQMVDLYQRVTGPKRLELQPGDHATAELPGLAGLPNHVWTSQRRWFDQYLKGVDTGIGREPGIVVRPHHSGAVESYRTWSKLSTRTDRLRLGAPQGWDSTGWLGGAAGPWEHRIRAGVDTTASGGVALLTNGLEGLLHIPPTDWLPSVSRYDAGVWMSERYAGGVKVRGIPRLHLSLTSSRPAGTVVAYLYDVDRTGTGRLVSHAPFSWRGQAATIDLPMQVTAFDVAPGHQLALVVDTKDALYFDDNGHGGTVTFHDRSWLDLPTA